MQARLHAGCAGVVVVDVSTFRGSEHMGRCRSSMCFFAQPRLRADGQSLGDGLFLGLLASGVLRDGLQSKTYDPSTFQERTIAQWGCRYFNILASTRIASTVSHTKSSRLRPFPWQPGSRSFAPFFTS